MTRNTLLLIVAAVIGLLTFAGVSKFLDTRTKAALEDAGDSLRLHIAATDARLEAYSADSARFETEREQFDAVESSLRADLEVAEGKRQVVIVSRDSARATIQIDTLTAPLRNLLTLERKAAVSFRRERDILARRVRNLDARAVIDSTELAQLGALIRTVRAERDSAMTIIAGHEGRLEFNFFRNLFQDLPRKAACAGAGAIVAEVNNGKALTGAAIALGICLAGEAIF
ncbi:hypothetical protein LCGC14_1370260 [marine sediment metagenome]|uniref:Uncharacterized protein n=1 Tax=marine sediment metagenome TaxID=412755 RepID=A0A0F9K5Z7_9ZZZZ